MCSEILVNLVRNARAIWGLQTMLPPPPPPPPLPPLPPPLPPSVRNHFKSSSSECALRSASNCRMVKERLEMLDRKVQEATTAASSIAASASSAAAAANSAATSAAAAASAAAATAAVPNRPAHCSGALIKTSSFEFSHNTIRFSREGSTGAFGSGSLMPQPGAPAGASPLGRRGHHGLSQGPANTGMNASTGGGGGGGSEGEGLAVSLGSPRRGRFLRPSTSEESEESAGAVSDVGGGPMGRLAGRPGGSSSGGGGAGAAFVASPTRGVRRAGAVLLQQQQLGVFDSMQDAMPSLTTMPESLPSLDSAAAAAAAAAGGGGGGGSSAASQHWVFQNVSSVGNGPGLSHSQSAGHGQGQGLHHHHHHHLFHSHSQGHSHSHSHGHGHGPHHGHSNSMGSSSGTRGPASHTRNSHHGSAGGAFGSVAMLFPTLRHGASADDLPGGALAAATAPSSPPPPPGPLSPRYPTASGSSTPYAGVTGGGGGHLLGLDVARMSISVGGGAAAGATGGGAAPSLARDSLRSAVMSEPDTERVEAASIKHFKGISPRLVEIYRQRAEQSHWSLQSESLQQLRTASRRGSTDILQRPTGLSRPPLPPTPTGGGTNSGGGGASRISLLHGGTNSSGGGGGGGGGGKPRELCTHGGGGGGDEGAGWVLLDPNYDHPPMIGDDDEYYKPMTLLERLKLYLVGLIRPEGRTKWDLFILVLLAWVLFGSPVVICFGLSGDTLGGDWVRIVELCVDLAFTFDIYLNFRTAYYDSKGHLVTERWRIARHYLKTWFLLDLICIIPYDLITAGTMGFLSMLKLLRVVRVGKVIRMIRMYRLLRVIRLPRLLEQMEMFIDRGVLQVMAFILSVCLLAHLSACIFFYMAYLDGLGPQTWVAAYGVQDADLATKYLTSLYWAFTTTATVGYGDITPKTDKEKVIAIFVMCLGVSLVGYVTSSITNIMAIKNAQQTNIAAKKQLVMDVLKSRSVPSELSRRVYNYFDYVSTPRSSPGLSVYLTGIRSVRKMIKREEATLLAELPFKLRARLLTAFHTDTLSRIPGIARLPPHVMIELVTQLKPHYFVEGDIVAMQGDYVDGLYIVSEGLLEVRTYMFPADVEPWRIFEAVHKDELRYMPYSAEGRLKPRYFFGQAGVRHGGVWPATVIARNCCELYSLDKEGLEHMMAVQPELQDMLGIPRAAVPGTEDVLLPCRGLMQSMLRSMGHMITGGLARASAAHYPSMYGTTGSPSASSPVGGGGGGGGRRARGMLSGLMVWRRGNGGGGGGGGGGGKGGGGGGVRDAAAVDSGAEPAAAAAAAAPAAETKFSRFRPFGRRSGPRNASVVQLLPSETSSLLPGVGRGAGPGGERSDTVNGGFGV
ncbi:hypothetical protein VOLCADRAFT_117675 [Volvox carteri f. nagariensis]|uniref:Cyclic nucleotide-binding domain-containing protein n=1 Tax=Volvox carteri f. nagariensis TaxID=3068 RepID=D8TWL1_VOLCA|nr:uncharacterized protein VOLCADRAFT_117675 [Volvox carteri f. nagariensis]EFJ48067.1 hypothetical protein VOLCADRAFT_117675 [Volvox carteri f. nagariensis]|eukprot:XP_002950752.1 hypothetical protein VOLCADRAFT_117675 [Volvox carteri f. nagariensis]